MRWSWLAIVCVGCGWNRGPDVEWSGHVAMDDVDLHGELWIGSPGLLTVMHTSPGGTFEALTPIREPELFTLHLTSERASEERLRDGLSRPVAPGEVWESYHLERTSQSASGTITGLRTIDPTVASTVRFLPKGDVPFGVKVCLMERGSGDRLPGPVPLCSDDGDANRVGLSIQFDPDATE